MRNTILAAAAAVAMVVAAAPTFAADSGSGTSQGNAKSSSVENQCANILAKGRGSAADREMCQSQY
jgi:hypothetical protein